MLEDFNFFDKRKSRKIIDTRIPERNRKTKQADSSNGGGGGGEMLRVLGGCWRDGAKEMDKDSSVVIARGVEVFSGAKW